jgi:hypothetical protein
MSPPAAGPSDFFTKNPKTLAAVALGLAAASLPVPYLAIPAFLVAVIVTITLPARLRVTAGALAIVLSFAGFVRFVVNDAAPAIILAGQRSAEEKAVSRLREILWAEDKVKELKLVDGNGDGVGDALFLGELVGVDRTRRGTNDMPLLRPDLYLPVTPEATKQGIFRAESYLFAVYLTSTQGEPVLEADVARAAPGSTWVAYAWPIGAKVSGSRVFFIDADERICEADATAAAGGVDHLPKPFAALAGERAGGTVCGGPGWRPWKRKGARETMP